MYIRFSSSGIYNFTFKETGIRQIRNILTRIATCYKKVRHNKSSHSFILQPQYKYNQQLATFTCTFISVILWCELSSKVSF